MRTAILLLSFTCISCVPATPEVQQASLASATPTEQTDSTLKVQPADVGRPAPDFTLTDLDGKEHALSAYKGKTVVLEWFNPGCPFVVAAYEGGPLQAMVSEFQAKDVVWLAINSGAPGKQGHGTEVNQKAKSDWGMSQPVLVDESGTVGKLYGARVTPHMYVINPEGTLVYAGALDNAPRNVIPESGHVTFTRDAIEATLTGEPVKAAKTQAWGCTVKYGS